MKKLLFILFLSALFSCKIAFVPGSSPVIKAQVLQGIKTTDSLFIAEAASIDRSYDVFEPTYTSLQSTIHSIQVQDSARAKSGLILLQVARLKVRFDLYVATHKLNNTVSNAEIETYQNIIDALWLPILVSENSLK